MSNESIIDNPLSNDLYKELGLKEKIIELARKIRNKDLYFLDDDSIIKDAKKKRKFGEFKLFSDYIEDKNFRTLYQLGLTLRGYEKGDQYQENAKRLRETIKKQYRVQGLHISYFAQNGLFSELLKNLWEKELTEAEIALQIKDFLKEIDSKVMFIYRDDDSEAKIQEVLIKIRAHSPEIFIISSMKSAMDICKKIKEGISEQLSKDYDITEYSIDDSQKEIKLIYFLNRKIKFGD